MVFLTEKNAQNLSLGEARAEAFKYSRLLKSNATVLVLYEKQIAKEKHQAVLFTQEQFNLLKQMHFGKSSEK